MPLKNEKARAFILRYQNKADEMQRCVTSDDKLEFYDNFLMDCKEASQALKEDLNYESVRRLLRTYFVCFSVFQFDSNAIFQSSIHLFIHSFIELFIHSFLYLNIHWFIYSFIHSFIH